MKKVLFAALLLLLPAAGAEAKHRKDVSVGFSVFYSSLSPYGEWIEADMGYAWRPYHVGHGWRPYMRGHWAWTDYGWYWVSAEPFGWATYHYGRWQYDDFYGWVWIPDRVWGPAWVEWRYDDDYIGWAPLSPYARWDVSIGITFSRHWVAPVHYWNFVPCGRFTSARVVDYVQPVERSRRIFGNTRSGASISMDRDRVINRGLDVNFVERRTHERVERADLRQVDRPDGERLVREGSRRRLDVFRPKFDAGGRDESAAPPSVRRDRRPLKIEGMEDGAASRGTMRDQRVRTAPEERSAPRGGASSEQRGDRAPAYGRPDRRSRGGSGEQQGQIKQRSAPEQQGDKEPRYRQQDQRSTGESKRQRGQIEQRKAPEQRGFRQQEPQQGREKERGARQSEQRRPGRRGR